jgi:hypothetical protein
MREAVREGLKDKRVMCWTAIRDLGFICCLTRGPGRILVFPVFRFFRVENRKYLIYFGS